MLPKSSSRYRPLPSPPPQFLLLCPAEDPGVLSFSHLKSIGVALECPGHQITQCAALCVWCFSLSIMLLRFIYGVANISNLFLFVSEYYSPSYCCRCIFFTEFFFFLSNISFVEIQFPYHTIHLCKMYSSEGFSKFTELHNHYTTNFGRFSSPFKRNPASISSHSPVLLPQFPATTNSLSVSTDLSILDILYKRTFHMIIFLSSCIVCVLPFLYLTSCSPL